ncbi:GNAT family N-acetyltransferase [Streptacidiphilus sp. P02-A3a]|uniref:GNAT family N-acetyltransferase n=1 Tax=Streptacidiphilus sp. P02-A3a TaxID=2704468 RepID=UPI0015F9F578|nr:GNAT family N-acetyltransferase [Streptacidiphilus sp. P02-A3a]QMU67156.1 GNAT family N-acetyltransferase [Streptacidiphilus sp. P02-A3a]
MTWTLSTSLVDFRAAAGDFLAADPVRNTVPLTVVDRLTKAGPYSFGAGRPRFGWWREESRGPVSGVFVQTPPLGVVLGVMGAEAAGRLAEALAEAGDVAVPSVHGNKQLVTVFARSWERATGGRSRLLRHERLYHLGTLARPQPAPNGSPRLAVAADHALLVGWYAAFAAESGTASAGADFDAVVGQRTAEGLLHVWEDGGRPVALAAVSPVIAGMSRIGPVYTPSELRRRGYAGGVVAAGSAHALGQGATEVLLYTDLENPTSNSIYQRLGYVRVEDALVLDLEPAVG